MKKILCRTLLAQTEGKKIFARGLYVKKDKPLPAIGESVVAICNINNKKFSGKVTSIDGDAHTYTAEIDLSEEVKE